LITISAFLYLRVLSSSVSGGKAGIVWTGRF